jgi:phosphoglycerol transferase MdoB-like AlkP superfamily enzyme
MTNLQVCITALLLFSTVGVASILLVVKEVEPMVLWIILALLGPSGAFVMCFVTWSAYQQSLLEKCQVTSSDTIYWTDQPSGSTTKYVWVNLGDRRFCKIEDERSYWAGIGAHLPYTITGVVENR